MLGRAAKAHEVSHPKPDLAKQLFASSSPAQDGNIQDQFKKARQSTQSIGGFTGGYTNTFTKPAIPSKPSKPSNSSNALRARSPNIKQSFPRNPNPSSTASSTLSSVFSNRDSFLDSPDMIDLTQEIAGTSKLATSIQQAVHFDENDFDDDEDLDLDMEYDVPMSIPAPPKPTLQSKTGQTVSHFLPQLPRQTTPQPPASSAQTWSSSSPSHKRTPPGVLKRRQEEIEQAAPNPNPRQPKRRTIPWAQKRAEDDEIVELQEEQEAVASSTSSQRKFCIKCNEAGHYIEECKRKGSKFAFTPKDKRMPWNNTGSAIAEEKKRFKDKQKASRKADSEGLDGIRRSKPVAMAPITLSSEQQKVLDLVVNQSKSVFFTGSAGTGKSVLMRAIIAELRKKYSREPDRVAVTASTGLAACNIGGVTLHSFGGIGLGKEDVPALVKKIKRNAKAKNRWIRTKILIVDEISMVDGDLFDKLEGIARAMRNNGRPFGGIQLVITGDFFQLPPVPDYDNKARGVKFAFDAGTWSTAIHHTIGLTEVFRQKDPGISSSLNSC